MMPSPPYPYKYYKIGKLYFYAHQNPAFLTWLYCTHKDPALFQDLKVKNLLKFFIYQIGKKNSKDVISLPCRGQLCIPVNKGYKVFNFLKNSVWKVFNEKVDKKDIANEIQQALVASRLVYAPSILSWNIEGKWYEEDYLSGLPGTFIVNRDPAKLSKLFHQHISYFINSLIFFSTPKVTISTDYLNKLNATLINDNEVFTACHDEVSAFINHIIEKIQSADSFNIFKSFTYGDLRLDNIRVNRNGLKVVDWETSAYRSITYDFYNYFFSYFRYNNIDSNVVRDMGNALSSLCSRLALKSREIAKHITANADVYRWFHYLERFSLILSSRAHVSVNRKQKNITRNYTLFKYIERTLKK